MKLPSFTQRPQLWAASFTIWFITLWCLSARPGLGPKIETPIPLDKIAHFGYFFGGAGLLTAAIHFQKKKSFHWSTIHLLVVLSLFAVGSLDEWHQSWYVYRSGNDAGDLTADIVGALVGTYIFRWLQPKLFPQSL